MKIGIDISQIVYEGTGVARFVDGLTRAIVSHDKKNSWTFFFSSMRRHLDTGLRDNIMKAGHRIVTYPVPPTALSYVWNTLHRMKVERLTGPLDLFITSDWTEPPSRMPKATIVHDLAFVRYPETVHTTILETQKKRLEWIRRESRFILADSRSTKSDLTEYLHSDGKNIHVCYPGVTQAATSVTAAVVKQIYRIVRPFILTVGKIEPRKNLKTLISAFERLETKTHDLVIVGTQGWDTEVTKDKNTNARIRFLSYVPDRDLTALYRACTCFVYPSLWEGFGYPLVEAMQQGAPSAASVTSSLGEIGRDAALLFDPRSVSDIGDKLQTLIADSALRQELSAKGKQRSRDFDWKTYITNLLFIISQNRP